jgi:Fe-S-cluster-containing dehydrogenase component
MKQLGFLVHLERCLGCRSCEFSCKSEHGYDDTFRRKIHSLHDHSNQQGHSFHHFSMSCNHCENPVCMSVCPENAIQKKPNGIVVINQSKCTGCGLCEMACPFDAITINPITAKADKCDMCYSRQMRGEKTICMSSCPVQAIEIIDIYDPQSAQYEKEAYGFEMKKMTKPSIRFTKSKEKTQQFWLNPTT